MIALAMSEIPTVRGRPDWRAILEPYGFSPPSRTDWLTPRHVRYLYFMELGEMVKVGVSRDPKQRLNAFRAGQPRGLHLRSTIALPAVLAFQTERRVHAALSDHAAGREWFKLRAKDANAIARPICARAEAAAARLIECGFWHDQP